MYLKKL